MKPSERLERIERNLEFLAEGAARHEAAAARHDQEIAELREMQGRAWNAIEALADKQAKLDDSLATLTEAQIRTQERFHERIDKLAAADAERGRRLDERVDKLVSAIGELIRRDGGKSEN